ncbi:MAG: TIGR00645 family protein [Rhizomicrobium sp.]
MSIRTTTENAFEALLFASRWLMAPIYLGLVVALAALAAIFVKELFAELLHVWSDSEQQLVVWILTLIDMSLAGNLLLMVLFAGYENFVSKMNVEGHPDKPHWMGRVDFSNMKLKLVASIIAISVIELLKVFMSIDTVNKTDLAWLIGIHATFVLSGVLLAVMDRLGERGLGPETE